MRAADYSPAMQELLAKNILLSRGGNIYPQHGLLTYPVTAEDGKTTERSVSSIHFTPGWYGGYYVYFTKGFAPLLDPEDRARAFKFIIENYTYPDRCSLDEKELRNRLDIRMNNISYISEHGDIDEQDFEMIEDIRSRLAKARDFHGQAPMPLPGDLVEGAYYSGNHPFRNGVIESEMPYAVGKLSVCAQPYTPWAHARRDGSVFVNTSGGPFFSFDADQLEFIGPDTRLLEEWSHIGPCANGAIAFTATVNRWKVKENVEY